MMMAEPEDEALSWAAPADPTHVDSSPSRQRQSDGGSDERQAGSVLLIAYGVFAGIYLLFTIGWMIAALRNPGGVDTVFGEFMYKLGQALAMAAPGLWLATAMVLTRNRRAAVRVLWLLIGALLLIPWPFVVGA